MTTMVLTKANLKKLITEAVENKDKWFVDEVDSKRSNHLSFRISPKIIQGDQLLAMLEWRSIAPSGMLWDDEQGSHSVTVELKSSKSMEELIESIASQVTNYMRYSRHISFTNHRY